jgi:DNA-binding response OmpR family regulator
VLRPAELAPVRVLIIDGDPALVELVQITLHKDGIAADVAFDGISGMRKADSVDYDVVVLDRDLPGLSGDEICTRLNSRESATRILLLSASSELSDLLAGLDLGADDYLAKPFRVAELAARVRALGRRTGRLHAVVLRRGDLVLDPARMEVTRAGRPVTLTHREFGVLEQLLRADGDLVSAETLLEHVWDEFADPFTSSVRVIMSRLRAKLGAPQVIHTVVGRGYRV